MNIYKSSGQYLGFIAQDNIFRWDGKYLGWIDNQKYVWGRSGEFRGQLREYNGYYYILRNSFQIPPVARSPKPEPAIPILPTPTSPAPPYPIPIGVEDAF